jgi:hypothetical protein
MILAVKDKPKLMHYSAVFFYCLHGVNNTVLGLGLETVRQLSMILNKEKDVVILTSRSPELGLKAVESLNKEGQFHHHPLIAICEEIVERCVNLPLLHTITG